jgi:hypothetical protein
VRVATAFDIPLVVPVIAAAEAAAEKIRVGR